MLIFVAGKAFVDHVFCLCSPVRPYEKHRLPGVHDVSYAETRLDLNVLKDGIAPGLTASVGESLAEAACVCLADNKHDPESTVLGVRGDVEHDMDVLWEQPSSQALKTHYDLQDATEDGACGIAIALLRAVRGKLVVRKAYKGKDRGFDYWLGPPGTEEDQPFSPGDLRMEVSGILRGEISTLNYRLEEKKEQVQMSETGIAGIAVVVLFSEPLAALAETNE